MAAHTITVTSYRELWWTRYRWHCTCGHKSTRTYDEPDFAHAAGQGHASLSRAIEAATNRKTGKNPSTEGTR